ncbi:hypothetical protein AB0F81_26400 [Actinoplanes sp. NPDC024001]|uniref:hypothetical protein n=1 Tax=Actinoplanes sp. NPDC024001 TaxID=3154598 RepID=UPI0033CB05C9
MSTQGVVNDEAFLGGFRAFAGHGLLIFRDVRSENTHAGYSGVGVHVTPDSLYVPVQHPVDGPVVAEVFEEGAADLALGAVTLFEGTVSSQQGEFVLHDADDAVRLRIVTDEPGEAQLRISADAESSPAAVRFQLWY